MTLGRLDSGNYLVGCLGGKTPGHPPIPVGQVRSFGRHKGTEQPSEKEEYTMSLTSDSCIYLLQRSAETSELGLPRSTNECIHASGSSISGYPYIYAMSFESSSFGFSASHGPGKATRVN